MDDTIESVLFILGVLLVVVALPLMWLWRRRQVREVKEQNARSERKARFEQRLLHPDYDAFASRYGGEPPAPLRRLLEDHKSMLDGNFDLALPFARQTCFVAWFEPMDEEHMSNVWRGAEGFYSFANDGSGNQYLVIPRDEDPEVWFYNHETGERESLGIRLSQFLAAERTRDEDA